MLLQICFVKRGPDAVLDRLQLCSCNVQQYARCTCCCDIKQHMALLSPCIYTPHIHLLVSTYLQVVDYTRDLQMLYKSVKREVRISTAPAAAALAWERYQQLYRLALYHLS